MILALLKKAGMHNWKDSQNFMWMIKFKKKLVTINFNLIQKVKEFFMKFIRFWELFRF